MGVKGGGGWRDLADAERWRVKGGRGWRNMGTERGGGFGKKARVGGGEVRWVRVKPLSRPSCFICTSMVSFFRKKNRPLFPAFQACIIICKEETRLRAYQIIKEIL